MSYVYLSEHVYFRSLWWVAYRQFTWWVHLPGGFTASWPEVFVEYWQYAPVT